MRGSGIFTSKEEDCMGKLLAALLHLQFTEREVAAVKSRLRVRQNAIAVQQQKIEQCRSDWDALREQTMQRRKEADGLELDLNEREEKVAHLRNALNTAKTNKEYAAILTEINTLKADNAKLEDRALRVLQDIDTVKAESDSVQLEIDSEQQLLDEIEQSNSEEIVRLNRMLEELTAKRTEAAKEVPPVELAFFERISEKLANP